MIYPAKQLEGYHIHARDGVLGTVKDIFFDDAHWFARYFVVATGSWLKGRQVLLAAARLAPDSAQSRTLAIDATQEQVRNSPPLETHQPVSRQQEQLLHDYFGWPYYWGIAPFAGWAMAPVPPPSASPAIGTEMGVAEQRADVARPAVSETPPKPAGDPHLRSAHDVRGYSIAAMDGELGHVEDFLLEDSTWEIRQIVVDTRNWIPGRKVLLAPSSIQSINWSTADVRVDLAREQIRHAPAYDPSQPLSSAYTDRLEAHYRTFRRE